MTYGAGMTLTTPERLQQIFLILSFFTWDEIVSLEQVGKKPVWDFVNQTVQLTISNNIQIGLFWQLKSY